MSPRTGRPKSEKPLNHVLKVRVDDETYEQMTDYCKKHKIPFTAFLRKGIKMILDAGK